MKVQVEVTAQCRYIGEVEMTQAEYDAMNNEMDEAKGFGAEEIAQDLIERMGLRIADATTWDDFEVDTFQPAPEKAGG